MGTRVKSSVRMMLASCARLLFFLRVQKKKRKHKTHNKKGRRERDDDLSNTHPLCPTRDRPIIVTNTSAAWPCQHGTTCCCCAVPTACTRPHPPRTKATKHVAENDDEIWQKLRAVLLTSICFIVREMDFDFAGGLADVINASKRKLEDEADGVRFQLSPAPAIPAC